MSWGEVGAAVVGGLSGLLPDDSYPFSTPPQIATTPMDQYTQQWRTLAPMSPEEELMAQLQYGLAQQGAAGAAGGAVGGMSLADLMSGTLPQSSMDRIHSMAYGGLQEAGREASKASFNRAEQMGIPLSSIQQQMETDLLRPSIEQASQRASELQMQELGRLGGLRQTGIENMQAMQNMPALTRLLQLRMAEATEGTNQAARTPGSGAPNWSPGGEGEANSVSQAQSQLGNMRLQYDYLTSQMNQIRATMDALDYDQRAGYRAQYKTLETQRGNLGMQIQQVLNSTGSTSGFDPDLMAWLGAGGFSVAGGQTTTPTTPTGNVNPAPMPEPPNGPKGGINPLPPPGPGYNPFLDPNAPEFKF
jgi:hypothetical protein